MWILEDINNKTNIWLKPGITITVGRKDSDILILNDRSVSRKHAKFLVEKIGINKTNDPTYKPQVILKDLDSKFGTTVNMQRINGSVILLENSSIKFGAFSEYRLKYVPIVICFSSLTSVEKAELIALAVKNGITITKSWNTECTHLIMNKVKVTQKVILALVFNKEIVNMKWLEDFENCDIKNFKLPVESNFFPLISENDIFDKLTPDVFRPNIKRKELYKGITFVIFSLSQCNKLASIIEAANGSYVSLYDKMKNNEIKSINDLITIIKQYKNTCMVEPAGDISDNQKQIIINTAKFLNQRLIDDSEIGFSVIYASTDVFTNKDISVVNNQTTKIKETQYLPTLANNSIIFNPQSNDYSKSGIFLADTNTKLNKECTISNNYNSDDSKSNTNTNDRTQDDNSKLSNDDKGCIIDLTLNDTNKSSNNDLFDDKSFLEMVPELTKNENFATTINDNTNINNTTITNNIINKNHKNDLSDSEKNNIDTEKQSSIKKTSEYENKNHSIRSEKSQNLSLFWDNLIDISSGDENDNDNESDKINDIRKDEIKDNYSVIEKNGNNSQKENNYKETNTINNTKKESINKSSQNVNDDVLFNNISYLSDDNSSKKNNNDYNDNINDIDDKVIKNNNEVKEHNIVNNDSNKKNIENSCNIINEDKDFLINDNHCNIDENPLFYKYDLIIKDENQDIYDEDQVMEDINKEKEKLESNNRKRKNESLFDKDEEEEDIEKEETKKSGINEVNENSKLDFQYIDELKVEATVSFTDDLISNNNSHLNKNKSNYNEYHGVNFKRFKKSKYIKNSEIIDRNSLFYYEDNKISEEWLMDNEAKMKKNSSEAMLVKTNTLINANSVGTGDIVSMLTRNSIINNSINNDNMFVVDDDSNIYLTEKDVKKRKINKKSSKLEKIKKKQTKDEFFISDSDDEEDEKFVWN